MYFLAVHCFFFSFVIIAVLFFFFFSVFFLLLNGALCLCIFLFVVVRLIGFYYYYSVFNLFFIFSLSVMESISEQHQPSKILFLYCDGVISPLSASLFSAPHMQRLKRLLSESGADLVLSCPWRTSEYGREQVSKQLATHGIPTFIDVTPELKDKPKAVEILTWLGENKSKRNITNFVVISDQPLAESAPHPGFFARHVVQTSSIKGIRDEDVDIALKLLEDSNNLSSAFDE